MDSPEADPVRSLSVRISQWLLAAISAWAIATSSIAGVALVIGNAAYPQARLDNPGNDARSIAKALREAGFEVTLALDQTGASMRQSMQAFGEKLAARKQPGVFYFAGHGAQLDWNNYLIPVDARPTSVAELRSQAVSLDELFRRLQHAGNGVNVVILDACRDNPFSAYAGGRGLSQTDAPNGTFLAYATAPGNVALDGLDSATNSLYTENLLREMKVPGVRVEDVFKRVRLNVRLKSNGKQVPWESTSLEDDFTFFPAAMVPGSKVPSDVSRDAVRNEWDAASAAGTRETLQAFLQKYPSSAYSELAQNQLEKVLATSEGRRPDVTQLQELMAVPDAASRLQAEAKPSALRRGWEVGDLLVYQEKDQVGWFKRERTLRHRVLVLTDGQILTRSYDLFDQQFNRMRTDDWQWATPAALLVGDYTLGKTWTTEFRRLYRRFGGSVEVQAQGKVVARDLTRVPAGAFETFRVELKGNYRGSGSAAQFEETYWVDVASGKPVRYERKDLRADGTLIAHDIGQLMAFENAGNPNQD